jgi:hypothetical protein
MTDSTGVIAISFLAAMGIICFFYITKMANDLAAQIMTGMINGTPISTSYRWLLLYQTWLSYAVCLVGWGIFLAAAEAQIAQLVSDERVKMLGYLAAVFAGVGALNWLVNGAAAFVSYRTVLRQAEAD